MGSKLLEFRLWDTSVEGFYVTGDTPAGSDGFRFVFVGNSLITGTDPISFADTWTNQQYRGAYCFMRTIPTTAHEQSSFVQSIRLQLLAGATAQYRWLIWVDDWENFQFGSSTRAFRQPKADASPAQTQMTDFPFYNTNLVYPSRCMIALKKDEADVYDYVGL